MDHETSRESFRTPPHSPPQKRPTTAGSLARPDSSASSASAASLSFPVPSPLISPMTNRSLPWASTAPSPASPSTTTASPAHNRSDRFIPSRRNLSTSSVLWSPETFTLEPEDKPKTSAVSNPFLWTTSPSDSSGRSLNIYESALRSELLGLSPAANMPNPPEPTATAEPTQTTNPLTSDTAGQPTPATRSAPSTPSRPIPSQNLRTTPTRPISSATEARSPFRTPTHHDSLLAGSPAREQSIFRSPATVDADTTRNFMPDPAAFSVSPLTLQTQDILSAPPKTVRKIPKTAYKVLDVPNLQDDFYLNLLDWSCLNVIAVGLQNKVYFWNPVTSKVSQLTNRDPLHMVSSISWNQKGNVLAVGNYAGNIELWDINEGKLIETLKGHRTRVGILSWNSTLLSSGSRDRVVLNYDIRASNSPVSRFEGHKQEICGLKWSSDDQYLASGGNDNKLLVWANGQNRPMSTYGHHTAAIKAIGWSPHQRGILASGGGTADRTIRIWNTQTEKCLSATDTGSQICNLMWSKNVNEIVTTHGYSQHQISVWKCPSMSQIATMTGHHTRVLYLATSPDGCSIVTGAGDETLRFWSVFPESKASSQPTGSHSIEGVLFR